MQGMATKWQQKAPSFPITPEAPVQTLQTWGSAQATAPEPTRQHDTNDTMSNATDTPKKQGQRRRRRRGGRNRNNNQNNNNQNQQNRSQGGNKGGEGRPRRRRSRSRKPVKLSFWEKLMVAIGLKEDPNKRKGKPKSNSAKQQTAPKSNTRNARSKDGGDRPKADSTNKRNNRNKRDRQRKGGDPSTVKSNRVYVGNLSYDVTEQDLKELFKGVGTVRGVEIVYNRNTHRSKGYGFVDMMNQDDAIRSVEVLHDQPFMGRNMTVSGANNRIEGDEEDNEPTMEIKASDLELAPLPEEKAVAAESTEEPAAEEAIEESAEPLIEEAPAAEASPESESEEDERKQD